MNNYIEVISPGIKLEIKLEEKFIFLENSKQVIKGIFISKIEEL